MVSKLLTPSIRSRPATGSRCCSGARVHRKPEPAIIGPGGPNLREWQFVCALARTLTSVPSQPRTVGAARAGPNPQRPFYAVVRDSISKSDAVRREQVESAEAVYVVGSSCVACGHTKPQSFGVKRERTFAFASPSGASHQHTSLPLRAPIETKRKSSRDAQARQSVNKR